MGVTCRPLTALMKKDKQTGQPVTFEWSTQCEESFQKIKEMLISSPVLVPPDLDKDFFCGSMLVKRALELFWNKLVKMA